MKFIFTTLFIGCFLSYGQKSMESKIIIRLSDTTGLREKVKTALTKNNFLVKDLGGDTIATFPKEAHNITGYTVTFAEVKNNTVTLTGYYSLKKKSYLGYTKPSADSKRVLKYKGSKTWPVLEKIARDIGGDITYAD